MVELREAASVSTPALVEFLRARLARYEIPTDIAIVDQIPRTPSGKADLGEVRAFFSQPVEHVT
jgi:acyl-CoA synthetase (AMP-forming)/AMP-acid ligase II